MTKAQVAREFRTLYPLMPTKSLARLMYKRKSNKLLFKDDEDCRSALRYIEGKKGCKLAKQVMKFLLILSLSKYRVG
jgi:hypothetical protein